MRFPLCLFVGQPTHYFLCHRISASGDLLRRLVLNRMRNVNGVEAGAA
jgi:hypothetical protein